MNETPDRPGDGTGTDEAMNSALNAAGKSLRYPPTPDIAGSVRVRLERRRAPIFSRRLAQVMIVALLIVIGGLLAVPQVRAGLLELIRIGAVRILLIEPMETPTLTAPPTTAGGVEAPITATPRPLPTPRPTPTAIISILDLAGETTLAAARAEVDFEIPLPAYPPGLGAPDRVYVQDLEGDIVVLVWLDPDDPSRARMSLHILGPGVEATKGPPLMLEFTEVNGQHAIWTDGPYMLAYRGNRWETSETRRLVEGHVLIWEENSVTYRLETGSTLEEAVKIAESLASPE